MSNRDTTFGAGPPADLHYGLMSGSSAQRRSPSERCRKPHGKPLDVVQDEIRPGQRRGAGGGRRSRRPQGPPAHHILTPAWPGART